MPATVVAHDSALYDAVALRAVEARAAAELGDAFELMRRAGAAAWRELLRRWPSAQRIVVVCGPGNNGGDGYVLAAHAHAGGRDVRVLHLGVHTPRSELARRAAGDYASAGGRRRWVRFQPADRDVKLFEDILSAFHEFGALLDKQVAPF